MFDEFRKRFAERMESEPEVLEAVVKRVEAQPGFAALSKQQQTAQLLVAVAKAYTGSELFDAMMVRAASAHARGELPFEDWMEEYMDRLADP